MKLWVRIVLASAFFLGLTPLLIFYRSNMLAQAVLFIAAIICYTAAELNSVKHKNVRPLTNMLFVAILFLALGFLTQEWIAAGWAAQLQIGFLTLSAVYYSMALLQFLELVL